MFQFYFCTHGDFNTLLGAFFTFDAMRYAFAKPSRASFSFGKRFRAVERIEVKSPLRECGGNVQEGMIKTNIVWRHCNNKAREQVIMEPQAYWGGWRQAGEQWQGYRYETL